MYVLNYLATKYSQIEIKNKKKGKTGLLGQQIFRGTLHNYNITDTCIYFKKNPCTAYRWKEETSFMQPFLQFHDQVNMSLVALCFCIATFPSFVYREKFAVFSNTEDLCDFKMSRVLSWNSFSISKRKNIYFKESYPNSNGKTPLLFPKYWQIAASSKHL